MTRPWFRLFIILGIVSGLTACATATPTANPTARASGAAEAVVPITSIDAVKGNWAGVVSRTKPNTQREDFVELRINDDATFAYRGARTVGVFQGGGTLALTDGALTSASERGRATYRLYDRGGTKVIKVDAETADGMRYEAVLSR